MSYLIWSWQRKQESTKASGSILEDAVDEDSANDAEEDSKRRVEFVDVGGHIDDEVDDFGEDVGTDEISLFPLYDHRVAIGIGLQSHALQIAQTKTRLSKADKDLQNLHAAYGPMLHQSMVVPTNQQGNCIGLISKSSLETDWHCSDTALL